jgi:hypothetical protein
VADSEPLVKKVVVKKPQPEPQPLWTRVGADFTRDEIEERILVSLFERAWWPYGGLTIAQTAS